MSEILGRVAPGGGTAVRPTRLLRNPNRRARRARGSRGAVRRDRAHVPMMRRPRRRSRRPSERCGISRRSACAPVGALAVTAGERRRLDRWLEGALRRAAHRPGRDRSKLARGGSAGRRGRHPARSGDGVRDGPASHDPRLPPAAPAGRTDAVARPRRGLRVGDPRPRCPAARGSHRRRARHRPAGGGRDPANAAANELGGRVHVEEGTLPATPTGPPYPLVLANLVAAVLIDLAPRLAAHTQPGGALLASGIIEGREGEVRARCSAPPASSSPRSASTGSGSASAPSGAGERDDPPLLRSAGDGGESRGAGPAGDHRAPGAARPAAARRGAARPARGRRDRAALRARWGPLRVVERRPAAGEPRHRLTVVQALLKGDGLEMAIRAATEVGAAAFRLVVTDRCVVRELSPAQARAAARRG